MMIRCAPAPVPPAVAGMVGLAVRGARRSSDLDGQLDAEAKQGNSAVFSLGSPFGRLGGDSGGPVREDDGRLHLVPVLAAWARPPSRAKVAFRSQGFGIDGRRMHPSCAGRWARLKTASG